MTYTICTATRDFDAINDFVEYHLDIGFDKIVIYDNFSNPPVNIKNDKVEIIRWEHELVDSNAFNDHITKIRQNNIEGWTAFLDEDEFINTDNRNIKDAMDEFQSYDCLSLCWRLFGDKIDPEDEHETKFWKKYKYHIPNDGPGRDINRHQKVMCKNSSIIAIHNPHYAFLKTGKFSINVNGQISRGAFALEPVHEKIWIDHFHCRGLDDYIKRKSIKINNRCPSIERITESYTHHTSLATKKLLV